MKIFVTGGSGFVGQNVIPELIKSGYEIHALVRSTSSAEKVKKVGAVEAMHYEDISEYFETN